MKQLKSLSEAERAVVRKAIAKFSHEDVAVEESTSASTVRRIAAGRPSYGHTLKAVLDAAERLRKRK